MASPKNLGQWIKETQDKDIGSIVSTLATASAQCAAALRVSQVTKAQVKAAGKNGAEQQQQQNAFGDEVLSVDLICDKLISDQLRSDPYVAAFASEEVPHLQKTHQPAVLGYTVAFDPLDGSSIIGSNFAVGSIFGVWKGDHLVGQKVSDLKAAAITVYGPRTTFFVATNCGGRKGVAQFLLLTEWNGEGSLVETVLRSPLVGTHFLQPKAKVFAPGNLRSANQLDWYQDILKKHMARNNTLRYTGGMVPDVAQLFVKGNGIFMTPRTPEHKVKLRVCFECGPIAYLVEKAGGRSTDGSKETFLDWTIEAVDERAAIAVGSSKAIKEYLAAASSCSHQTGYQQQKGKSKL